VEIFVGLQNAGAETIDQKLMFVGQEQGKMVALRQLIQAGEIVPPTLVFTQSKERCKELYAELVYEGVRVDCIHAERTQAQRDLTVQKFRSGEVWVLVCTDLMGRGIDFKGVNCVINYDFPTSAVSYIHRIGRTGRARRRGKAITFFTIDDIEYLRSIANIVRINGCEVPEWMLKLKKTTKNDRKRLEKAPPNRAPIRRQTTYDRDRAAKRRNMVKQSKASKQ
jgi:ATP-dependent RNA helicase DDX52/ROK1